MQSFSLFPPIMPYTHFMFAVDDTHTIYVEECGNPKGYPVLFLHGGPGSGCNATQRQFFDPNFYRIILLDQRGCGRSTPQGYTQKNTTDDLVLDLEKIRQHLGIEKWLVFGGSWGSTLALCYALAHSKAVAGLILRGIFLSRPTELSWFLKEVRAFFPEAYDTLCAHLPASERHNPLEAYEKRIFSQEAHVNVDAAIQWNAFETSIMSLLPRPPSQNEPDSAVELARARVQIHYIQNHCFVGHRDLLQEASALAHIPCTIIQGRYDMVCPPITAWALKNAMPHARFEMVADAGHSAMEQGITSALVAATQAFACALP